MTTSSSSRNSTPTASTAVLAGGHAGPPPWEHDADMQLPTPDEVLGRLDLADAEWTVLLSEEYEATQTGPDGQPVTRLNNILKIARR